jgi:hypothetical protein
LYGNNKEDGETIYINIDSLYNVSIKKKLKQGEKELSIQMEKYIIDVSKCKFLNINSYGQTSYEAAKSEGYKEINK